LCIIYYMCFIYYYDNMGNKKTPESIGTYQFSELYYKKKEKIQEANYYEFIEFLNRIENINNWEKKEEGKRLVDEWFNKYSDWAIVWLFDRFVSFKKTRAGKSSYEDILNEAKSAFRTEIYGENIIKPLFGYYGNYLKSLKRKRINSDLKETVGAKPEKADKLKKGNKQEVAEVLKTEKNKKDDINKENEKKESKRKEPVQLTIQFPKDNWEEAKKEDNDPNMDELYKFDPEKEKWWDR